MSAQKMTVCQGVFTLGDVRSFLGLTSKNPPLGSMLNFDADVKDTTARHLRENHCPEVMAPLILNVRPVKLVEYAEADQVSGLFPSNVGKQQS